MSSNKTVCCRETSSILSLQENVGVIWTTMLSCFLCNVASDFCLDLKAFGTACSVTTLTNLLISQLNKPSLKSCCLQGRPNFLLLELIFVAITAECGTEDVGFSSFG